MLQLSRLHFGCWTCAHRDALLSSRGKSFVCLIQWFPHTTLDIFFFLLLHLHRHCRALSSSSPRATSTWLSTTSRCCMTESWPAPSLSPTTPRQRMPSSAWSRRPGKTLPSSSTHRTHSCYRLVWLVSSERARSKSQPTALDVFSNAYVNDWSGMKWLLSVIIELVFHRLTHTRLNCICENKWYLPCTVDIRDFLSIRYYSWYDI